MKNKVTVFNCVSMFRKNLGLTQHQLAKSVGVSKNAISSIERNEYMPTLKVAMLIACCLRTNVHELFWLTAVNSEVLCDE